MTHNVWIALEIMGKGMAGIFVATLLIIGVVCLLSKVTSAAETAADAKKDH